MALPESLEDKGKSAFPHFYDIWENSGLSM